MAELVSATMVLAAFGADCGCGSSTIGWARMAWPDAWVSTEPRATWLESRQLALKPRPTPPIAASPIRKATTPTTGAEGTETGP
ncbi:MAG: hypothetical protein WDM85_17265 [Caulobacteraceae bacterium]